MERKRIALKGIVQGVGFRPFVYRTALRHGLSGFVQNNPQGVIIEVEGENLAPFLESLRQELPPLSHIDEWQIENLPLAFSRIFEIRHSDSQGQAQTLISPDVALCRSCAAELADPANRRYRYPFINCTDCGPRFTIIEGLPYDRSQTTMKGFALCPRCRREYSDPADRRYHAQPVSCFGCGPTLALLDRRCGRRASPLSSAAREIKRGAIVAVKGLGGYHLACLARSPQAIRKLRRRKKRESKPFALMGTLGMIEACCQVSPAERELLQVPAAPIVLLKKRRGARLPSLIARGLNRVGFLLPYTPLHQLLVQKVGEPLVMTSANLSDDPILFSDEDDALKEFADFILTHDRPIQAFCDDSLVQADDKGQVHFLRRSRGYVPLPLELSFASPRVILGVGGLLKATFTLLTGNKAWVSQYIGTLESPRALAAERRSVAHFVDLFGLEPEVVVLDKHPLYPSRLLAADFPHCQVLEVQHHRAHLAALLAENGDPGPIIGMTMDGTGYGDDGRIWGGEFFVGDLRQLRRAGHLRYLFLPGGDQGVRQAWRFALSLLYELFGDTAPTRRWAGRFGRRGEAVLEAVARRQAGVLTSSCGRLFDGAAALLGLGQHNGYDGQLPMLLQARAERSRAGIPAYGFSLRREQSLLVLDFLPALAEMLDDRRPVADKAWGFQRTLADGFLATAKRLRQECGIAKVGLSGGVFQNLLLLRLTVQRLEENGFQVLLHRRLPANDGCISLGQAALAAQTVV